jgi:hypothetical protein
MEGRSFKNSGVVLENAKREGSPIVFGGATDCNFRVVLEN